MAPGRAAPAPAKGAPLQKACGDALSFPSQSSYTSIFQKYSPTWPRPLSALYLCPITSPKELITHTKHPPPSQSLPNTSVSHAIASDLKTKAIGNCQDDQDIASAIYDQSTRI
ncbi:hypothetical protein PGT21_028540 [Puccinia graminis f. sp. tritici]|uniref:Uncharacterized protein n=1 Tax=Puccinia graminis f. sp. tritici TaxID=56615 RepID=A0A5B0Q7B3_PUCGR|nr:hypothetical protein PGT21_028540 [Puccinia graminis f. sp. tritici]KAA1109146.1 hypothetical protein PGTUg99_002123 [Puccinia graminis f. sp. tritici]